jgi:hypothetical protein
MADLGDSIPGITDLGKRLANVSSSLAASVVKGNDGGGVGSGEGGRGVAGSLGSGAVSFITNSVLGHSVVSGGGHIGHAHDAVLGGK